MKFELLEKDDAGNRVGPHQVGNQIFRAGQVLESDAPLDQIFRNKFKRVHDNTPSSKPEIIATIRPVKAEPVKETARTVVVDEEAEEIVPSASSPEAPKSKYGMDVTEDFADFAEAELTGMKVFEKDGSFIVVDVESETVLKRAKSDKIIIKFLKSQLS